MPAPIYLDHHATTPCDAEVLEAMLPWFTERFGNASSRQHSYGRDARIATEIARREVASLLSASPRDITFTSGATEGLNWLLKGLVQRRESPSVNVVVSSIEHPAVLDVCDTLERDGVEVRRVPVPHTGIVDPEEVAAHLDPCTAAVAVMAANNEIGTLQPIAAIGERCREHGAPLVCDAAQAGGRIPIDVATFGADALVLSGHKLYGPKGVGAVWVRPRRPPHRITPLIDGGGHERGLRAGTLAVPLLVGMGRACALATQVMADEAVRVGALRDTLLELLQAGRPDLQVNGSMTHRLANNLNISLPGIQAEELLTACGAVIALSSGSACSTDKLAPSHVLGALGLEKAQVFSSLRFGLGRGTTHDDVVRAAEVILAYCARVTPRSA
ncbi:MAG: cysteine desulfurase family protein [Myxococcota bacterium]